MRNVPFSIPLNDKCVAGIPLLDESFDEEDDVIEGDDMPWHEYDQSVPATLKVRGYP